MPGAVFGSEDNMVSKETGMYLFSWSIHSSGGGDQSLNSHTNKRKITNMVRAGEGYVKLGIM